MGLIIDQIKLLFFIVFSALILICFEIAFSEVKIDVELINMTLLLMMLFHKLLQYFAVPKPIDAIFISESKFSKIFNNLFVSFKSE